MWVLLALFGAGAFAGLVDSSLGMGFGVMNTSFMLALGLAPAAASATVHAARIGTSVAGGTAHLRLGNVDRAAFPWLAAPGCVGGVLGAYLLVQMNTEASRPVVATFLLGIGVLMLWRHLSAHAPRERPSSPRRTGLIGLVAGAVDAFGGGGWGPIATPGLIVMDGREPRKAVGTVDLAQIFVSATTMAAFLVFIGAGGFRWDLVLAVGAGGVVAAPFGAHLAKRLDARRLAGLVGALLVTVNLRTLSTTLLGVEAGAADLAMVALVVVIAGLLVAGARGQRPELPEAPPPGPAP